MKCPIFEVAWLIKDTEAAYRQRDCLLEECAWWLEDVNLCALKELALEARYAQFRLQDMVKERR